MIIYNLTVNSKVLIIVVYYFNVVDQNINKQKQT